MTDINDAMTDILADHGDYVIQVMQGNPFVAELLGEFAYSKGVTEYPVGYMTQIVLDSYYKMEI